MMKQILCAGGIGLFLTARALPDSPAIRRLARLGGVSLGVYAVHLLVLRLLMPWTGQDTPGAVLLLSALIPQCLSHACYSCWYTPQESGSTIRKSQWDGDEMMASTTGSRAIFSRLPQPRIRTPRA